MKRKIVTSLLFVLGITLSACSIRENSFNSQSEEPESSFSSDSSIDSSDIISSTSGDSSNSVFSYPFEDKDRGLTLEQITEEINKMNPQPEEKVKVRYTWHIVEKITGNYFKTMLDGSEMPEGEIVGDFVSEPKNNLDTNIQLISGTPVTQMQQFYARQYTSSVTPSGWLGYHSQRRQFLDNAQEGEGFEERFYTNPLTLWMRIWGRRPANAQMDGIYFGYEEFERVYNSAGYCTSLKIKEYTYMKGSLSSWNNPTRDYDGSYEYSLTCAIEYLD